MADSAQPETAAHALRAPAFWLLWPTQLISTAGSALAALAATILVYAATGSALSVGLMLVAAALPGLIVGLFAAQVIQRAHRPTLLLATGLARVVLLVLIPVVLPYGLRWVYLLIFLESAATQLYDPAFAGTLAERTSRRDLADAHTVLQAGRFAATAIGFVVAGLLATRAATTLAFPLDAATCALSVLAIAPFARRQARSGGTEQSRWVPRQGIGATLHAGLRVVSETPALFSLLALSLPAFVALGLTNALLLPFTRRALHAEWWQYSLLEALMAMGFLVGSVLLSRAAPRFHEGQLIVVAFLGIGLIYVEFAQLASVASIPVAFGLMLLAGVFNAPSVVARTRMIQRHSMHEARGQVASLFFVVRSICFLLGMAAAGLADLVAVRAVVLAAGALLLLVGVLALVAPGLRQSAAEWKSGLQLLRRAHTAPGLGTGRPVSTADIDILSRRWPAVGLLSLARLQRLLNTGRVFEVATGTRIVRAGERGSSAYFVLRGRVVVGQAHDGLLASSAMLSAGDIFGEIAALTGALRTADVVAAQPSEVLEMPAATLRELMREEDFGSTVLSRMTRRLMAVQAADLPRQAGLGQSLRDEQDERETGPQPGSQDETQTILSSDQPLQAEE